MHSRLSPVLENKLIPPHRTAVQPLFGQLANIWGRRWVTFVIVSLFTLGSGICGGATNGAMLIAGRAVQGIGSGGMNVIVDIIVSDLVPLRERGNYIAVVLAVYSIGIALGPWVGGVIVANTSWRWVFYINLPVCPHRRQFVQPTRCP